MLVAHPGGAVLEVRQGLVPLGGFDPGQGEGAGGGCERVDVAGVELGTALGEPSAAGVAEHEGEGLAEVVQVLAGVIEVHDLGGFGEVLAGQVPDPHCAVAQDGQLPDVAGAAAVGLGGHQHPEPGGRRERGQVGRGARVADGIPVLIHLGLGEHAGQLRLAGAGLAVLAFAGPALGLGADYRHAGAVDGDIHLVRQVSGRHRDDLAIADRRGPLRDRGGGRRPVGLGVPLDPPGGYRHRGQVREQPAALGERLGRSGPGGHLRQPPRHRVPGQPQLRVPGRQPVTARRAPVPGPVHRDRAEHRPEGLIPVGHELRQVPCPAVHGRAAVPGISTQQARQQRTAHPGDCLPDRQLRRLQPRPASIAGQRPDGRRGQLLDLGGELRRDLRAQLL